MSDQVELGKEYIDEPTGFIGVATARIEELGSTARIRLENVHDGEPKDFYFEEARLVKKIV